MIKEKIYSCRELRNGYGVRAASKYGSVTLYYSKKARVYNIIYIETMIRNGKKEVKYMIHQTTFNYRDAVRLYKAKVSCLTQITESHEK